MPFERAVLEGAAGIAVPTLISTLAICCVFVSVFFLQGAARYLFTPLAMAVVFAMLASYAISRTLTPIMIRLLLRAEHGDAVHHRPNAMQRFHARFNAGFDRFRDFYAWLLDRHPAPPHADAAGGAGRRARRRRALRLCRHRLLSGGRRRPDPAACPRPATHAHRADRADLSRRSRTRSAPSIPARDLRLVLDNIGLPQRAL